MTIKEKKNMKRIYTVGLCLMAVFALSAVAASGASATDLLARVAGGGSVAGVTFLSSSATLPLLVLHGGEEIHCKSVTNHGLFLNSTLGSLLIRFLGCTDLPASCKTTGAAAGEIHMPLTTTLFHFGLAHLTLNTGRIPAMLILLEKHSNIECGGLAILMLGGVIGALRLDAGSHGPVPLNAPFSTALLAFEQTSPGLQHLRLFLMPGTTGVAPYDLMGEIGVGLPVILMSVVTNAVLDLFRLSNGSHVNIELVEP
jgi:hypothetical protein